jgi:hypothetical protein
MHAKLRVWAYGLATAAALGLTVVLLGAGTPAVAGSTSPAVSVVSDGPAPSAMSASEWVWT